MSAALEAVIRDEIATTGPLTFARFMELALYYPELGYYVGPRARATREGDFLTAPELHPVFGRVLARVLDGLWEAMGRPDPFTLREYGAGSGALAVAIVGGLHDDRSDLLAALRYEPVEHSRHRRDELAGRLATLVGTPPIGHPEPGRPIVGAVLANEFLDALPVHRVTCIGGELRELCVDWTGGSFASVPRPPSTPALAARLSDDGVRLAEGQVAEICLALDGWLDELSRDLLRGYAIVIDYGHPASTLYGPERLEGTLRAYVRHTVHADPFRDVGEQDLTAHVDLTALERGAAARGLALLGRTTQARFLVGAGMEELLEASRSDPAIAIDGYLLLRSSIARLLDPRALGGFAVVVLGRGVPAPASLVLPGPG